MIVINIKKFLGNVSDSDERIQSTVKTIVIIVTSVFVAVLVYNLVNVKMLNGTSNDLQKIVITIDPNKTSSDSILIRDKAKLKQVYDLVQSTKIIYINRFPSHIESIQFDSKYIIMFYYADGGTDCIKTCQNSARFYRHMKTKGMSIDPGYVEGENEELRIFLDELK